MPAALVPEQPPAPREAAPRCGLSLGGLGGNPFTGEPGKKISQPLDAPVDIFFPGLAEGEAGAMTSSPVVEEAFPVDESYPLLQGLVQQLLGFGIAAGEGDPDEEAALGLVKPISSGRSVPCSRASNPFSPGRGSTPAHMLIQYSPGKPVGQPLSQGVEQRSAVCFSRTTFPEEGPEPPSSHADARPNIFKKEPR